MIEISLTEEEILVMKNILYDKTVTLHKVANGNKNINEIKVVGNLWNKICNKLLLEQENQPK